MLRAGVLDGELLAAAAAAGTFSPTICRIASARSQSMYPSCVPGFNGSHSVAALRPAEPHEPLARHVLQDLALPIVLDWWAEDWRT